MSRVESQSLLPSRSIDAELRAPSFTYRWWCAEPASKRDGWATNSILLRNLPLLVPVTWTFERILEVILLLSVGLLCSFIVVLRAEMQLQICFSFGLVRPLQLNLAVVRIAVIAAMLTETLNRSVGRVWRAGVVRMEGRRMVMRVI